MAELSEAHYRVIDRVLAEDDSPEPAGLSSLEDRQRRVVEEAKAWVEDREAWDRERARLCEIEAYVSQRRPEPITVAGGGFDPLKTERRRPMGMSSDEWIGWLAWLENREPGRSRWM